MPERDRAMSERDGTMTDVASTYVLCPRLVSVNFRLRIKEESCEAEVGWCGSKHGVMGSKCGARWSKGYVFLFDSQLESCLEASPFKYRITEISEKGLH